MATDEAPGKLAGKVAFLTGAGSGMGAAEARRFVAEGARVVVADIALDRAQPVAAELGDAAWACHLDVAAEASWAAAAAATLDHFGRVDILVNNAGILLTAPIRETTLEQYRQVVGVNQIGCWLGMKTMLDPIRAAGGGAIVNISSLSGITGNPGMSAYASTKWAVRGLTKVAAAEFGEYGIRVNAIIPGAVDTGMPVQYAHIPREEKDRLFAHLPVPRVGRPEDIANLALFLVSDESSYITGSEFVVDGGRLTIAGGRREPAPS